MVQCFVTHCFDLHKKNVGTQHGEYEGLGYDNILMK
jgi:hypothetical protein